MPPFIQVLTRKVNYHADPTAIFAEICGNRKHSLLLESAEISSKNSIKSLLFIDTAIKISCIDHSVTFSATSKNGQALLNRIKIQLAHKASMISLDPFTLIAHFPMLSANEDEDTNLQATTIFDGLRALTDLFKHNPSPIFIGGLFSYDLIAHFIPMNEIKLQDGDITCPDYCFYLAENLLIIDHQSQQAELQTFCFDEYQKALLYKDADEIEKQLKTININQKPQFTSLSDVMASLEDVQFKTMIESLKHHIYIGDVFQIVPSRRFSIACNNPLLAYRQLKKTNPSPYMFYIQDEQFTLFGASPESALKYNAQNRQLEIYPIAGSRPRGMKENGEIDHELDARLELELRLDNKELAEHLMLVDLARNDVARVCVNGSRQVKELMQVDRYSHIMHLVSRVIGTLRPELDALHAYQACMNMGTLTGAPKIKAVQLIYQYEQQKRHSYGGAVGYLTSDGNFDTCIVIRSAFIQNKVAYIQAGCGVVLDSVAQLEADETRHKARAVINAIIHVNQLTGDEVDQKD